MTPAELDDLEALANAATEGPWTSYSGFVSPPKSVRRWMRCDGDFENPGDSVFIAASREAVPKLIAEIRKLRAAIQKHQDDPLHRGGETCDYHCCYRDVEVDLD